MGSGTSHDGGEFEQADFESGNLGATQIPARDACVERCRELLSRCRHHKSEEFEHTEAAVRYFHEAFRPTAENNTQRQTVSWLACQNLAIALRALGSGPLRYKVQEATRSFLQELKEVEKLLLYRADTAEARFYSKVEELLNQPDVLQAAQHGVDPSPFDEVLSPDEYRDMRDKTLERLKVWTEQDTPIMERIGSLHDPEIMRPRYQRSLGTDIAEVIELMDRAFHHHTAESNLCAIVLPLSLVEPRITSVLTTLYENQTMVQDLLRAMGAGMSELTELPAEPLPTTIQMTSSVSNLAQGIRGSYHMMLQGDYNNAQYHLWEAMYNFVGES